MMISQPKLRLALLALVVLLIAPVQAFAQAAPRIAQVVVEGNRRVEEAAILRQINTREGDLLDPKDIGDDIRRVYDLGFFEDIVISIRDASSGVDLVVRVQEKPSVREIIIEGNDKVKDADIREKLTFETGQILNESKVRRSQTAIEGLYQEKGFYLAEVEHEIRRVEDGQVDIVYTIREYQRVRISDISFIGNEKLSAKDIQGAMQTRPHSLLSFLSKAGRFNSEIFAIDLQRIRAFYYENGYLDVEVGEPLVELSSDRSMVSIRIPITEGEEYSIQSIQISGETDGHEDKINAMITAKPNTRFASSTIRGDSERIMTYFKDLGYAFADVIPGTDVDPVTHQVRLNYRVRRGEIAHIGRIDIVGNTVTRDRVVRRELVIAEGDRYSTTKIRASMAYIQRLGFFENVDLREERSTNGDGLVNLMIEVTERPTRQLQVGAGYSSYDGIMANAQVSENNLFGRGQSLSFALNWSKRTRNFEISFLEPRLAGTKWQLNVSLFNRRYVYPQFSRDSLGASFGVGYMLTRDLTLTLGWRIERIEAQSNSDAFISAMYGGSRQLSIGPTAGLFYDTRNDRLFPSAGMYHGIRGEISDSVFGAEQNYLKARVFTRFYWAPFWDNWVIRFNGELGRISSTRANEATPITERYFLGGSQTVRGFDSYSLSPCVSRAASSDPGSGTICDEIGGHKSLHFNLELEFPIVQSFGLKGVVFMDAGNAFGLRDAYSLKPDFLVKRDDREDEYGNVLRTSVGFGVRWRSPIGPLRFEWGIPLARLPGMESPVRFEFGIGNVF